MALFSKSTMGAYQQVGIVCKTHGLSGTLVLSLAPGADWTAVQTTVFIQFHTTYVPYRARRLWNRHGKVGVLLKGVSSQKEAQAFVGKTVCVRTTCTSSTPKDCPAHAVGCRVEDLRLGGLGVVQAVLITPQQQLLSLQHKGREVLIPYHVDLVEEVDLTLGRIRVKLPLGLIEEV